MNDQGIFIDALRLIATGDAQFLGIVGLSLAITFVSVAIACVIGLPLGAALAVFRFPGRGILSVLVATGMGLPPVVVGLVLYLLFSQAGPLAVLDLLYTPAAMVIAQVILVTPIVTTVAQQVITDLHEEYGETLRAMRASGWETMATLLRDGAPALVTAALAGLGRAFAEVGAVMIVGGNINHATRVMTTAIALETSRGALELALALGIVLLVLSLIVSSCLIAIRGSLRGPAYA